METGKPAKLLYINGPGLTLEGKHAVKFFYENAAFSYPEGSSKGDQDYHRMKNALDLMQAEEKLYAGIREGFILIKWREDEGVYPDSAWIDNEEITEKLRTGALQMKGCILQIKCPTCAHFGDERSLWEIIGTFDDTDTYPRVVEAELYREYLDSSAIDPLEVLGMKKERE